MIYELNFFIIIKQWKLTCIHKRHVIHVKLIWMMKALSSYSSRKWGSNPHGGWNVWCFQLVKEGEGQEAKAF